MDNLPGGRLQPSVIEFDLGSFVLTAFGVAAPGSIRGDRQPCDRYLNLFLNLRRRWPGPAHIVARSITDPDEGGVGPRPAAPPASAKVRPNETARTNSREHG